MKRVLPIVEGDGDEKAVPELIRRIGYAAGHYDLQVLGAQRRGDLPKVRSRFEDFLRAALLEKARILWVMDYDCKGCNGPVDPESIRDAKGWLSDARPRGLAYKETVHQVKLAARVDLDRLRVRSPSFQRFEQAVTRLLNA